jgi:hypothetical protein
MFLCTEQTNNKDRASRQTHTQGNNKNNEEKQHRNKTQMENMQSVTTKGSEAESFMHMKIKYHTQLKMAM